MARSSMTSIALLMAAGSSSLLLGCSAEEQEGIGFVSFSADLTELYGDIEVQLERNGLVKYAPGENLGSNDSVALSVGKWIYEAHSIQGFDWFGEIEVRPNEYTEKILSFDTSASTFFAAYVKTKKYLPTEFLVDRESVGVLDSVFVPPVPEQDLMGRPCREIRSIFLEAAEEGNVLIASAPVGIRRVFEIKHKDGSAKMRLEGSPQFCLVAYSY